jgi:hypothetical protein
MTPWINPKQPRNNSLFRNPNGSNKGIVPALAGDNNGGYQVLPPSGGGGAFENLLSLFNQFQKGQGGQQQRTSSFGFSKDNGVNDGEAAAANIRAGKNMQQISGVTNPMMSGGIKTDQSKGNPDNIFGTPVMDNTFMPGGQDAGYNSNGFFMQPPGSANNIFGSPYQPVGLTPPQGRNQGWNQTQLAANAGQQRQNLVNQGLAKIPGLT